MSKFKIKMKLSGFELEIEGSKEDIPNIQQALSQQLGGLLQPGAGFIEDVPQPPMRTIAPETITVAPSPRSAKPRRKAPSSNTPRTSDSEGTGPFANWPPDVSKYCAPTQGWTTREKGLWLLYVAKKENIAPEASSVQVRDTFNLHYKQSVPIKLGNLNRDFGSVKGTLLAEDLSKKPSCWFLTDDGIAAVEKRIAELKSGQSK